MFNGIINSILSIFFLKFFIFLNYFFVKLNKFHFNINIGESISFDGVCLTLIYRNLYFFEFEFSYITFLNICILNKKKYNIERSLTYLSSLSGHSLYSHNNNLFFLKNKFFTLNIIKLYIISILNNLKYFIYKISLSINGISLTLNEIVKYNNFLIISLNILRFTYYYTSIKYMSIFCHINIELESYIFFILKIIYFI